MHSLLLALDPEGNEIVTYLVLDFDRFILVFPVVAVIFVFVVIARFVVVVIQVLFGTFALSRLTAVIGALSIRLGVLSQS